MSDWYVQTHLKRRGGSVAEDVTERKLRELSFDTQKYSGAAIANLVNLAAMRVERDGRDKIQYKDLTDVSKSAAWTPIVSSVLTLLLISTSSTSWSSLELLTALPTPCG